MADGDIRLSTTTRRASATGVWLVGWIEGGVPVSVDPASLIPSVDQLGGVSAGTLAAALAVKQDTAGRGVANGYASLDSTGRVPAAQLPAVAGYGATVSSAAPLPLALNASPGSSPDASRADHAHPLPTPEGIGAAPVGHTHSIAGVSGLQLALDAKLGAGLLGISGGVAPLGADGRVPNQFLPPGVTQAALDAKADLSFVTTQLAAKANATDLAAKASATDTRLVNAIQPDFKATIEAITAAYTAVAADANKIKRYAGATDINVTLPALPVGTVIRFVQAAAGKMTFLAGTSQTIGSFGGFVITAGQSANVIATVDASNSWNISGNLM